MIQYKACDLAWTLKKLRSLPPAIRNVFGIAGAVALGLSSLD